MKPKKKKIKQIKAWAIYDLDGKHNNLSRSAGEYFIFDSQHQAKQACIPYYDQVYAVKRVTISWEE